MRFLGKGTKARSVVLAAALGLGAVVLPAAPASAATCTLSLVPAGNGFWDATVNCTGVQQIYGFKLYGSDGWPNPDDYLASFGASGGIINGDVLNEDVGARDEIYAKVRLRNSSGQDTTVNSNRVDGYFGCVVDVVC
jgi:hypothetical protein